MSNNANGKNTASLLIRRLVAILISAAAIMGLFMPMLTISKSARSAFRRVKTEQSESCKDFIEDLPAAVTAALKEEDIEKKYIRYTEDIVSDLVYGVGMPLYNMGEDLRLTLLEVSKIVGLPAKAVDVFRAHEDELDDILRDFGDSDPEYKEQEEDLREALATIDDLGTASRISSLALYGLFGVTLLMGVLSILMELLNRPKSFPVLFCIFAFLTAALFALMVIGPRFLASDIDAFAFELESEELGENLSKLANAGVLAATTLGPGLGLFLLPMGALAACIVYKRDRSYAGVLPKRTRKVAPAAATRRPKAPSPKPAQIPKPAFVPPVEEGWTCDVCGQQNDGDSKFCSYCGSKRPQRQPVQAEAAARFCPVCGRELSSDHQFCPGCGTRVAPEA